MPEHLFSTLNLNKDKPFLAGVAVAQVKSLTNLIQSVSHSTHTYTLTGTIEHTPKTLAALTGTNWSSCQRGRMQRESLRGDCQHALHPTHQAVAQPRARPGPQGGLHLPAPRAPLRGQLPRHLVLLLAGGSGAERRCCVLKCMGKGNERLRWCACVFISNCTVWWPDHASTILGVAVLSEPFIMHNQQMP